MSAYQHSSELANLASKIKPIRFGMFTTVDQHGHLVSRPMTNQQMDHEGNLWFFTSTGTDLWESIAPEPEVNVSFAEPDNSTYVSISGRAERVVDREQIKQMWNTGAQAWFPAGSDDPHAVLIRVKPHAAEYWDADASRMVQMVEMAKAVLSGTRPEPGEHGRIRM